MSRKATRISVREQERRKQEACTKGRRINRRRREADHRVIEAIRETEEVRRRIEVDDAESIALCGTGEDSICSD